MKSLALHKRLFLLTALTILCAIFLTVLYELRPIDRSSYRNKLYREMLHTVSVSDFSDQLFRYEITQDSITTAYHLRQPERYRIPSLPATLSSFDAKEYEQAAASKGNNSIQNLLKQLQQLPHDSLSDSESLCYDLMEQYLSLSGSLQQYPYYESLLGASTGVQVNLPVTLCEYPLTDASSVDTYLQILQQIPDYFNNVIRYETKRTSLGYPVPSFLSLATKQQLQTFLTGLKETDNCFTETFSTRIQDMESLSASQKKKYILQNQDIIRTSILPAYETLYAYCDRQTASIDSKQADTDTPATPDSLIDPDTDYGLCSLPSGKDYYSYLVRQATGSSRSITDLITMTDHALQNTLGNVLNIALTDQTAYLYYCEHPLETYYNSPEAILEALSLMIRKDYPVLKTQPHYVIKQVPKSLAASLSPAFYMIPAMDDYSNNTIYINSLYTNDENGNLFTTLAHEGFPGHLYQTVYFNSTRPSPIRQILDYPGYVEGWASYVEMNIFPYLDYPLEGNSLCKLYQSDTIINLALCSRIDLGVNYEGWTLNDTRHFFEENGFRDYYAENVYSYVVESPSNYLSYFIGYLEIEDLKSAYHNLKMENYSDQDFHKHFLDIGPADFDTIRKSLLAK
ncbi:uncharacterized protein BN724_01117 [Clostridium sp. CAG:590]|nr:uncharacterized protein BN724_01117 [Clostridium sp. CAG:590]